jgi:hypothetical protein
MECFFPNLIKCHRVGIVFIKQKGSPACCGDPFLIAMWLKLAAAALVCPSFSALQHGFYLAGAIVG